MLKETGSVYEKVVSEDMLVGRVKWLYYTKGAREIDSKKSKMKTETDQMKKVWHLLCQRKEEEFCRTQPHRSGRGRNNNYFPMTNNY